MDSLGFCIYQPHSNLSTYSVCPDTSVSMEGMDGVKEFLQSSTIHGLVYIASSRRNVRLFWLCVVTAGFIGAGLMIRQSFSEWASRPVSTTIETLPISGIPFPNISVCPPRSSFTTLIPDLIRARNITFDQENRRDLAGAVSEAVYNATFQQELLKFSLHKPRNFISWYTGETKETVSFQYLNLFISFYFFIIKR